MRKSLGQELSELAAPRKAADPELVDALEDGPALLSSDDELLQEPPTTRKRHIFPEVELDAKVYGAKKTKRARISRESSGSSEGSSSEEEASDAALHDTTALDLDCHNKSSRRTIAPEFATIDEDEWENADENDDNDDTSHEAGTGSDREADDDDEPDEEWRQLEKDFDVLQAPKADLNKRLSGRSNKAAAVAQQQKLWDCTLGVRISLQRSLVMADRIPRSEAFKASEYIPDASSSYASAKLEASNALQACSDAMNILLQRVNTENSSAQLRHESVPEDGSVCSAWWERLEQLQGLFSTFRDTEADRWHRRTMLQTGKVAMRGLSGLQALNKPPSLQVADVMRHPERALAKLLRQRQEHTRVLCEEPPDNTEEVAKSSCIPSADVHMGEKGIDPDSFDDAGFYHVLLQEFLDSAEEGQKNAGDNFKMPKQRKAVDRRASKGRKVRFSVMDRLVGFMEPSKELYTDLDDRITSLYCNLFGSQ